MRYTFGGFRFRVPKTLPYEPRGRASSQEQGPESDILIIKEHVGHSQTVKYAVALTAGGAQTLWQRRRAGHGAARSGAGARSAQGAPGARGECASRSPSEGRPGQYACRRAVECSCYLNVCAGQLFMFLHVGGTMVTLVTVLSVTTSPTQRERIPTV